MKRWGKDWSVYRTVKEVPVTVESSAIKHLKNGNGWDQYVNHTLPDKATLKRNLENVRSSTVDPEGDDYDAFDESLTADEQHRIAQIREGRSAEELRKAKNKLQPGKLAGATVETREKIVGELAVKEKMHSEALKASEEALTKAEKKRAGRPAYPPDLLDKLEKVQKAGKAEGLSRKDLKEASIIYTKNYLADKKDAARKAALAAAAPKVGGAVAAAAAAAPKVAAAAAAPAAAVGGGGALPAAAAAAAKDSGDSPAEVKEVKKAAEAVEDGVPVLKIAAVKKLKKPELQAYALKLNLDTTDLKKRQDYLDVIIHTLKMIEEAETSGEE